MKTEIKANDLRVGNVLKCNKKFAKDYIVVNLSTFSQIQDSRDNNLNLYEPILLNDEILRDKCGMSSHKGWDDQFFWCLPTEYGNSDRFDLFETENGYELPSGAICKYLHQLQNCYYFHYLTNEELTINF